jgi:hypothetical protein
MEQSDKFRESLTSKAAPSRHECPAPRTPLTNRRMARAYSARPATVMLSPITSPVISAPPFPPVQELIAPDGPRTSA